MKLVHHCTTLHKDEPQLLQRDMRSLGVMYFELFQDYPRAAFWMRKGEVVLGSRDGVYLAECYWRLGNALMAKEALNARRISVQAIKLLGDMGQTQRAVQLAERFRNAKQPQVAFLLAGDACRVAGRFDDAIKYYEEVLSVEEGNENYVAMWNARARDSIQAIRLFEKTDPGKIANGTYSGSSVGYNGTLSVAVRVASGRIEDVRISQHEEKQFYSALTDTTQQIIKKQSVKNIDATSGATITSQAIAPFTVVASDKQAAVLAAVNELLPDQLDAVVLHTGSFTFYAQEPGRWPSHYTDDLASKEWIPAELFLVIDPLVSLSTAIASRSWVWSLACAAIILIVCVLIPRGFCGYLCPLGTVIDLFDWAVAGRVKRFNVASDGWWVHIKYYLLAGTLICALFGVLVTGYVAAIPVVTRGMLFIGEPFQTAVLRGRHLAAPLHAGHFISIGLFLAVLLLGFLRPRFWCKYVCPSGAVFSIGNLFRITERKVESSCINCNKCVEICPFDTIKPDFTTHTSDCTLCQTCGGVCPTHAIKFVERWNRVELKVLNDPPTHETVLGRRGFLSLAAGSAAAAFGGVSAAGVTRIFGAHLDDPGAFRPVRPPGSVPEKEFLEMCIRCGECFKVCPNNVLQAEGFQQGLDGLWTPWVNADWAGCESSCNACGQVCPTGAIRALPLEEKKAARMGLAIVNQQTCLPFAGREACQLCVDECHAAGYHAIEFLQVHTRLDGNGSPIADSGYLAPVVLAEKCVGCGLCQTRCYGINVKEKRLLHSSAIVIEAGEGKEDRLMTGSYVALRRQDASQHERERSGQAGDSYFVPE